MVQKWAFPRQESSEGPPAKQKRDYSKIVPGTKKLVSAQHLPLLINRFLTATSAAS
jgi:hypothetical protein